MKNKVDFAGKIYQFFAGFFFCLFLIDIGKHNILAIVDLTMMVIMLFCATIRFTEPDEK